MHTPGPWIAIPMRLRADFESKPLFDDGLWWIQPEGDVERTPICTVDHADDHDAPTRIQAGEDARLIASAPDLLDACKWFAEQLEKGLLVRDISRDAEADWAQRMMYFTVDLQKAMSAIAKAEVPA